MVRVTTTHVQETCIALRLWVASARVKTEKEKAKDSKARHSGANESQGSAAGPDVLDGVNRPAVAQDFEMDMRPGGPTA